LATEEPLLVEATREEPGVVVLRCAGEIDVHSCVDLREALAWSFTSDIRVLRVDLSDVRFIDSLGIQCLAETHSACTRLGVKLEVLAGSAVNRTLDLVGFRAATST
jgi:anti-anti-sigma factor